ncbi:MFS transporter [Haloglycomyces albus]|uniref:MFS transporter n=1 Tax=Haloglycomyces albus TaxID=526067 RepID=UPI00046D67FE|nr:MFS transporter [Haloglycomyces albus]
MTTTEENQTTPNQHHHRPSWSPALWTVLITASFALCLDALDVSMIGVALPSIGNELGMSNSSLQWIVSGYVLGYGGLLLLGGRAADLLGRKKVFVVSLIVFGTASLVGGLVNDGTLLIASRIVKGVAAAFTAPAAMSIVTTTFAAGPDRNRALSIFAVFGASGYASGLVLSGLLTEIGWRWTFLAPAPVVLAVLIAAVIFFPRDPERERGHFDLVGALTLTGGMLSTVYAIVTAPETGFTVDVWIAAISAVVLISAFFIVEQRVADPLIRLSVLRNGTMVRANIALMALFGSYLSFQTMMSLYLQNGLGWGALVMAMALAPAGLIVAFLSPSVGRLIDRWGTTPLIMGSLASMFVGYVLFLWRGGSPEPNYVADYLPSVILFGLGFALGFSSIISQATGTVGDADQGLASGLVNTSGQVGGALVLAVVTGLIGNAAGSGFAQFQPGLIFVAGVALVGFAVAALPMTRRNSSLTLTTS